MYCLSHAVARCTAHLHGPCASEHLSGGRLENCARDVSKLFLIDDESSIQESRSSRSFKTAKIIRLIRRVSEGIERRSRVVLKSMSEPRGALQEVAESAQMKPYLCAFVEQSIIAHRCVVLIS